MAKYLDMTAGRPAPLLWRFTLPTLLGNLLHQAYSITDSVVVGRYLGQTALAAVGCTSPIVMLLAALMIGINVGVGILISQYFGRRDFAGIRRALVNSLYLGLLIAVVLIALGLLLAEPILRWMGTPEAPLQDAAAYLRINFLTTVCPLFYYLFSSVFRGMGDSRTALYCLIVAALGNVGLDVLFVAVFRWGVAGSAWATALAQALSALFAAVLLYRRYPEIHLRREDLPFDRKLFGRITGLAVPIALQSAFNNLSNVVAQSGVNTFGETVMAPTPPPADWAPWPSCRWRPSPPPCRSTPARTTAPANPAGCAWAFGPRWDFPWPSAPCWRWCCSSSAAPWPASSSPSPPPRCSRWCSGICSSRRCPVSWPPS